MSFMHLSTGRVCPAYAADTRSHLLSLPLSCSHKSDLQGGSRAMSPPPPRAPQRETMGSYMAAIFRGDARD